MSDDKQPATILKFIPIRKQLEADAPHLGPFLEHFRAQARLEARARRVAAREGYVLRKSRWRVGTVDNHGECVIIDPEMNAVVAGERYGMSAEEVLELLRRLSQARYGRRSTWNSTLRYQSTRELVPGGARASEDGRPRGRGEASPNGSASFASRQGSIETNAAVRAARIFNRSTIARMSAHPTQRLVACGARYSLFEDHRAHRSRKETPNEVHRGNSPPETFIEVHEKAHGNEQSGHRDEDQVAPPVNEIANGRDRHGRRC
jgi:hypothetical protein